MMKFKLLHFEINKILLLSRLGILLMCSVASAALLKINKDFARVMGISNGTKLVQEMRGNYIIIKKL